MHHHRSINHVLGPHHCTSGGRGLIGTDIARRRIPTWSRVLPDVARTIRSPRGGRT